MNAQEASIVPGIDIVPVHNLKQLIEILNETVDLPLQEAFEFETTLAAEVSGYDFSHII